MADEIMEAVRGLHLAHPHLGPKPLLAKLREQQPDLGAGNKEVRDALLALKAEESKAAAAAPPAAAASKSCCKRKIFANDGEKWTVAVQTDDPSQIVAAGVLNGWIDAALQAAEEGSALPDPADFPANPLHGAKVLLDGFSSKETGP